VALLFVALFGVGASWMIGRAEDQAVMAALRSRIELARDEVAADGTLRRDAGSPKTDLVQVVGPDNEVRGASPAMSRLGVHTPVRDVAAERGGLRTDIALQRPDVDLALLAVPISMHGLGTSPPGTGALVVGVDAEGFETASAQLRWLLVVGLAVVVATVGALAWVLTGRALRSVTRLTESAERVGPNDLATGLPLPAHDAELARLVAALNRMLVRLHDSHVAELTFAAEAGHRLRTPVATLRAEAELALREPDPAQRVTALENIVRDADQLSSIVDRMLARSRNRGLAPEPIERTMQTAARRWERRAELIGVDLQVAVNGMTRPGDSCVLLLEVLEPIVDNALRHTPAAEHISVLVHVGDDQVMIDVANAGDGLQEDLAERVFEPWVSSRDGSVAGGLGLWLARETARDVGGDVILTDLGPPVCTFRVVLPVVSSR
jgi:two-component system, OmpR family, sensor kinase